MTDRAPILYEDGQMKRDYIHVDDVARANLLVMEREEANYQVYNVGSGAPTTQRQFASALGRKIGVEIEPVIPGEFRLGDVRHIVSDVSRLLTLGWRPRKNLDHILADYLSWIRTQGLVKDYFAEAEQIMKATGAVRPARRRNS
jgi:dTDP-L-rhamnose 4-epimerase